MINFESLAKPEPKIAPEMEEYGNLLTSILEKATSLTEWEDTFSRSAMEQVRQGRYLSAVQKGKVEEIFDKRVGDARAGW